jgi:hypothetical protein
MNRENEAKGERVAGKGSKTPLVVSVAQYVWIERTRR